MRRVVSENASPDSFCSPIWDILFLYRIQSVYFKFFLILNLEFTLGSQHIAWSGANFFVDGWCDWQGFFGYGRSLNPTKPHSAKFFTEFDATDFLSSPYKRSKKLKFLFWERQSFDYSICSKRTTNSMGYGGLHLGIEDGSTGWAMQTWPVRGLTVALTTASRG